jgi:hypothetical protein
VAVTWVTRHLPHGWITLDRIAVWVGIAYFVATGIVIGLLFTYKKTVREDAVRSAARSATMQATLAQCRASQPTLSGIELFLSGVQDSAAVNVLNAAAVVAATPKYDPQYRVRVKNLARVRTAQKKIAAAPEILPPTNAQCAARAQAAAALVG